MTNSSTKAHPAKGKRKVDFNVYNKDTKKEGFPLSRSDIPRGSKQRKLNPFNRGS